MYASGRYSVNVLPCPGVLVELDLAAQQGGELPADREAEAGAAVFPARARVGLLERLEDQPLLLGRDADAGVADFDGDSALGTKRRMGWSGDQPDVTACTRIDT